MPGMRLTKAPKLVVFTTVPRKRSPTSGCTGETIERIIFSAASAASPLVAPM